MAVNKFDNSMFDSGTIGTTANKLLQLDGSTKLPAVDGSLLTSIPASIVKSASSPTISTNNQPVGTVWVNTTSGETYCCTDATTGANVWKNIGAGTDNIVPRVFGGETYGYVCGGQSGPTNWSPPHFVSNQISKFAFASGNASDTTANLAIEVRYQSSHSSATHGYSCTGLKNAAPFPTDHIQKYSMISATDAVDIGNATVSKEGCMGTHSQTYGYIAGGYPAVNDISRFAFASDGDSADWADLVVVSSFGFACSDWNNGYGYVAHQGTNMIQKFPFASQTNSVDTTQNLTVDINHSGSNSSATHGYTQGGNGSPWTHIDKFQFNTSNHATDVGDLVVGRSYLGHSHPCSTTHGFSCGGTNSSAGWAALNIIEKFSLVSDGNATDHGDLHQIQYAGGFSQI